MASRTSARSVREILESCLSADADALSKVAILFGFAAAATAGEPLSTAAGVALILNTAASAVSAAIAVGKAFFAGTTKPKGKDVSYYDRFRVLYYVTCTRCFVEALEHVLKEAPIKGEEGKKRPKLTRQDIAKLKEQLEASYSDAEDAELSFLFCVEMGEGPLPLFEALGKWTASALTFYGATSPNAVGGTVRSCVIEATERLRVFIAQDEADATWMRQYLALDGGDGSDKVTCTLDDIRSTLDGWVNVIDKPKERFAAAWAQYREELRRLPDKKETMYNEQFGVRKVFLQPQVIYHVAGAPGEAGIPKRIPKLGALLGALASDRTSEEDLIVLCGGPGCGKSTLCRVLASELADHDDVFPVFLRLRRLREGADIAQFIEDSLHRLGVIDRLADLRDLSGPVIILDGFDELVMASRSRLRRFFATLRDEHTLGPLSGAKFIVSGRDTLFPGGVGLPAGTHVLALQPFDRQRVTAWGEKWRSLHPQGQGKTFHPERLLAPKRDESKPPPLHHLVSWPLTLHLVARVHTSGHLDTAVEDKGLLAKAYLYRSILAETAARQVQQAEGEGRLEPDQMRGFLRSLAWEMYRLSTDSMDPPAVLPIIHEFWPEKTEADMGELAEVAVVNCPELTKGEETGFEFVHKSFSEYLVAEHIAHSIERVVYQVPDYGETEASWRMSLDEASSTLAGVFGIRLLTEEVQEMLEPMLGCLDPFLAGERLAEVVGSSEREDGLLRIVARIEGLLQELLLGKSFETVVREAQHNSVGVRSPLELCANQCAGYLIVGSAAARQLRTDDTVASDEGRLVGCEVYRGEFWQCLCVLVAGGIRIDSALAARAFHGLSVANGDHEAASAPSDLDCPIPLGLITNVHGVRPDLQESARATLLAWVFSLIAGPLTETGELSYRFDATRQEARPLIHGRFPLGFPLVEAMLDAHLLPQSLRNEYEYLTDLAVHALRALSEGASLEEEARELVEYAYGRLRFADAQDAGIRWWLHQLERAHRSLRSGRWQSMRAKQKKK